MSPIYEFECSGCGARKEMYLSLSERDAASAADGLACVGLHTPCPNLGGTWQQVIAAPAVDDWGEGKYFEHLSPTGETFYSRKSFKRYLRDHGLRETNSFVD